MDSENNLVMGFDDMYGNYEIRVVEKFVQKTESGAVVNVTQTGAVAGSGRTVDEWILELMNSQNARAVPFWLLSILLSPVLALAALGF